jgi:hypothetical protein
MEQTKRRENIKGSLEVGQEEQEDDSLEGVEHSKRIAKVSSSGLRCRRFHATWSRKGDKKFALQVAWNRRHRSPDELTFAHACMEGISM